MGKEFGIFDVLGPVMIGPSSSHTAGAARLGRIAAKIAGKGVSKVTFLLHGSFAKTYKGHGTDRALLAGVLGMEPQDDRLKESFSIAHERGLNFEFVESDLGNVHPNTVKFIFGMDNGCSTTVMGSSIGGGSVIVTEIDGQEVEFTGDYPTIITKHLDKPGIITSVTSVLSNMDVNIAFMKVFRKTKGEIASMVVETDNAVSEEALKYIAMVDGIEKVVTLNPV